MGSKRVRVVREYHEGCSRTLLVCPSQNPPDTKSPHHLGTSQDTPGMSLTRSPRPKKSLHHLGTSQDTPGMSLTRSSRHQVTHHLGMSQDCPGMSLTRSSGHQVTPAQTSHLVLTVVDISLCPDSVGTCQTFVGDTGHPSSR